MPGTIAILKHAFDMIFRDPGVTLRALAPGLLVIFGAAVGMYLVVPEALGTMSVTGPNPSVGPGQFIMLATGAVVMLMGMIVTVLIWHRFVLLQGPERAAGLAPGPRVVGRYLWCSILLGLIMLVVAFPVMFIVGLLLAGLSGMGGVALFGLASVVVTAILGWIALRLSLVLPAAAISRPMQFKESWAATRLMSGTILGLTIALSILNLIVTNIVGALVAGPLLLTGLLQLISAVLMALISASVLTTLYGILIERRSLSPSD